MIRSQIIYNSANFPIGWIETDERGNKRVCSNTKGVVGKYEKDLDRTVTAGGAIVGRGDLSVTLLFK